MSSAQAKLTNGNDSTSAVGVCVPEQLLLRRVCEAIVAGGHTVSARTQNLGELALALNGTTPACLVLAFRRPDREALSALAEVRGEIAAPTVLVCERASGNEVRRSLELGVSGIVLVGEVDGALAPVISAVCAGQVSVPGGHRDRVRAPVLTTREKQILGLVVMGLTNAEIARKLFLAESTVKSHLSSAFSKLGVSSRNEAVGIILDPERGRGLGILTIPSERVPTSA